MKWPFSVLRGNFEECAQSISLRRDSHLVVKSGQVRIVATILTLLTVSAAAFDPLLDRVPAKLDAVENQHDKLVDFLDDKENALKDKQEEC